MPNKTSNETIKLIEELYDKGNDLSVLAISKRVNVTYPTVYKYTRAKQRGFRSLGGYKII